MRRPSWGDTVRIKEGAPPTMRPGQLAAVCGMREIETAEQARQFDDAVGAVVYLVEFGDGSSFEILEAHLEVVNDDAEVPDE